MACTVEIVDDVHSLIDHIHPAQPPLFQFGQISCGDLYCQCMGIPIKENQGTHGRRLGDNNSFHRLF
uniref:Uncharacterized protein n=1 Tax=Vitis vinifera TaxID=29760 RepID=F6I1T2_VITVI